MAAVTPERQGACDPLGSIPQHVVSVAHVPVAPPLLLPELVLPLLLPLLLPEPLLEVEAHSLGQFDWAHVPTFMSADVQADSSALLTHEVLDAALVEYVPPGHAQET